MLNPDLHFNEELAECWCARVPFFGPGALEQFAQSVCHTLAKTVVLSLEAYSSYWKGKKGASLWPHLTEPFRTGGLSSFMVS